MVAQNVIRSQSETIKIKEEIADKYIQKFKEELGWLKSLAILPIETKLKKIMVSVDKLDGKSFDDLEDLGFWKKILGFLTPKMSIEIFDFLKEKQEAILTAETKNNLDNLMQEIVTGHQIETEDTDEDANSNTDNNEGQNDINDESEATEEYEDKNEDEESDDKEGSEVSSTVGGGAAAVGAGATAYYSMKLNENMTFKKNPSLSKLRESYRNVIEILEEQVKNPKLLPEQKANIRKSIKEFEYARDNAAKVKTSLKELDALAKKGIMNVEDMSKMVFGKPDINLLNKLIKDKDLLKQLSKTTDKAEISKILKDSGLKKVPERLLRVISKTKKVGDLESVLKVVSKTKAISRTARLMRAVPFLDAIAFGMDVMTFIDESREAELIKKTNKLRGENKQSQAYLHLATGSVAAAAAIGGLIALGSTPPVGWIVLGVAAVGAGVNEVMDTYYFDVVNFYTQNKEDYKKQYRSELKNAIYQATIHGESNIPNSFSDGFAESFNFSESIKQSESLSLKNAYWAMIFQEETGRNEYNDILLVNPEFPNEPKKDKLPKDKNSLESYKESRNELLQKIELRMEYIEKFLPEYNKYNSTQEYKELIKNIKTANGINYIEKILGESKMYYDMKITKHEKLMGAEKLSDYKEKLKNHLLGLNADLFSKLEKISKNNNLEFLELYYNIKAYKTGYLDLLKEENLSSDDKISITNVEYILEYYKYKFGNMPIEARTDFSCTSIDIDYVDINDYLVNINSRERIKPYQFTKEQVVSETISHNMNIRISDVSTQVSDSVGQNIIYEVAKQLHGYMGGNNQLELMNFFREDKSDTLGMYYSNGWHLNTNNGIDTTTFKLKDFEKKSSKDIISDLFYYREGVQKNEIINTATDNGDDWLNKSYIHDVSKIIEQEKEYETPKYKNKTESDIINYIKKNSENGRYIQLPYYLVMQGQKVNIGKLNYYTFKYENNKVVALVRGDLVQNTLDFDKYDVDYEKTEKTREKLTEEELKLISKVTSAHDKLEQLRGVEGLDIFGGEKQDDLDIPVELERAISGKRAEWQKIQNSLYYTDSGTSKGTLNKQYIKYLKYFEGVYNGLLYIVNNASVSNDIDSIDYFNQAMMFTNGANFVLDKEKGVSLPEGILSDNQQEAFYQILKERPNKDGKSILELLKSENEEKQQEGLWYAKQVFRSILESANLSFDEKTGRIDGIYSLTTKKVLNYGGVLYAGVGILVTMGLYSKQEAILLDKRLKDNLSQEYTNNEQLISDLENKEIGDKRPIIKKVSKSEIKSHNKVKKSETEIINTHEEVDWSGKRGNIEKQGDEIISRGTKTKIQKLGSGYKIKGLPITIKTEEEAIRISNFINKVKGDLLKEHPENRGLFQWSIGGDLEINNGYVLDTNVLISSTIDKSYKSIKDKESFIEYLNSL